MAPSSIALNEACVGSRGYLKKAPRHTATVGSGLAWFCESVFVSPFAAVLWRPLGDLSLSSGEINQIRLSFKRSSSVLSMEAVLVDDNSLADTE